MTGRSRTVNMAAVTDLLCGTGHSRVVDDAVAAADAAARAAGVQVRQLDTLHELEAVHLLYERIWRPAGKNAPMTTELLRAMVKAGSYVGGAFRESELVGACVGFFSPPANEALHSHIAGVAAGMRGHNVGFALKVHQRAWAMLRGVGEISWTFDPLVRRNAYFNIAKLAADPDEYLPNFYGRMNDGINGSDDTDRILVTWRLDAPEVVAACSGQHRTADAPLAREAGAAVALDISSDGQPVPAVADTPTVLVAVPDDIEALRVNDSACAAGWRAALRDVLGELLADGARVRGFDRTGWYVVDRKAV